MSDRTIFEGHANFPSRGAASYRYKITAASDVVSFWIEDCKTKNQWSSGDLKIADFVSSSSVIPGATMTDYVSCFQSCLERKKGSKAEVEKGSANNNDAEAECSCDLVPKSKDAWSLKFVLALKLYASVWRPKYEMTLKAVPLQPIDILAAQLRDVQDELASVRSAKTFPVAVKLVTTTTTIVSAVMLWEIDDTVEHTPERFMVNSTEGKIHFLEPGWYLINLLLQHQTYNDYYCGCNLQLDGTLETNLSSFVANSQTSATISFAQVIQVKANQVLTVVNGNRNYVAAQSTMAIRRLA